jgi:Ca2+/H+ antiporter
LQRTQSQCGLCTCYHTTQQAGNGSGSNGTDSHVQVDEISEVQALEDEEEDIPMTLSCAVAGLAALTLLVALYSEYLVSSLDGFAQATHLSQTFIGSEY